MRGARPTSSPTTCARGWASVTEEAPEAIDRGLGRYLGFGHGGLLRRPLKGAWSGQGAPGYRTASAAAARPGRPGRAAARRRCGCTSRRTVRPAAATSPGGRGWGCGRSTRSSSASTWCGPRARTGRRTPTSPGAPPPREVPGVRLLPEFDAVLCGYDPKARDRFVSPADHELLWHRNNGYMLAPVLVDGRVGGYWRIEGTGRDRTLAVSSFAGCAQASQGRAGRAGGRVVGRARRPAHLGDRHPPVSSGGADEVRRGHRASPVGVRPLEPEEVHGPRLVGAVDPVAARGSPDVAMGAGVEADPVRMRALPPPVEAGDPLFARLRPGRSRARGLGRAGAFTRWSVPE